MVATNSPPSDRRCSGTFLADLVQRLSQRVSHLGPLVEAHLNGLEVVQDVVLARPSRGPVYLPRLNAGLEVAHYVHLHAKRCH